MPCWFGGYLEGCGVGWHVGCFRGFTLAVSCGACDVGDRGDDTY